MNQPVLVALALLSACPAAVSPADLVRDLASPSFSTRQRAEAALRELGRSADPVLREGLRDGSAQVRAVCARLLRSPESSRVELRLKRFLLGADLADDLAPPGWAHFRDRAGDTPAIRSLFYDVQHVPDAVELFRDLDRHGWRVARRDMGLRDLLTPNQPPAALVAATFVMTEAATPVSPGIRSAVEAFVVRERAAILGPGTLPRQLLAAALARQATDLTATADVARIADRLGLGELECDLCEASHRLLLAYRPADDRGACLESALALADRWDPEEGVRVAADALKSVAIPHGTRMRATAWLEKGGPAAVLALDSLTADRTPVGEWAGGQTLVGDVALAVLLRRSGQDPGPYGFANRSPARPIPDPEEKPAGFADDLTREAALVRWRGWGRSRLR